MNHPRYILANATPRPEQVGWFALRTSPSPSAASGDGTVRAPKASAHPRSVGKTSRRAMKSAGTLI